MEEVSIIGLDLAKKVFQAHGAGADGSVNSATRQDVRFDPLSINELKQQARQPGIGNLGFPRHAAEALDPGIADTFQFGADLLAAHRCEADG
jgi:hypothetical protein